VNHFAFVCFDLFVVFVSLFVVFVCLLFRCCWLFVVLLCVSVCCLSFLSFVFDFSFGLFHVNVNQLLIVIWIETCQWNFDRQQTIQETWKRETDTKQTQNKLKTHIYIYNKQTQNKHKTYRHIHISIICSWCILYFFVRMWFFFSF
jgi:hypothetical protein